MDNNNTNEDDVDDDDDRCYFSNQSKKWLGHTGKRIFYPIYTTEGKIIV